MGSNRQDAVVSGTGLFRSRDGFYRMQAEADESVSAIAEIEGGLCAGVGNCIYRIVKEGGNKLRKQQLSDAIVPFSDDWRISCLQADGDFLWIGSNRGLSAITGKPRR